MQNTVTNHGLMDSPDEFIGGDNFVSGENYQDDYDVIADKIFEEKESERLAMIELEEVELESENAEGIEDIEQEIVKAAKEIIELEQDKKDLSDKINAVFQRMQHKGICKPAMKDTLRNIKYTEEERLIYDNSIAIARRACGIPLQVDMFND